MPQEEHKFTEKDIQQLVAFFDYLDECDRVLQRQDKQRTMEKASDGGKGDKSPAKTRRKPSGAPTHKN